MNLVGFIHFDCLCGLDIYYFGDLASGEPPLESIEILRARLGKQQYAIFTSQDEAYVSCPCCESSIQLPDARIAAFFGQIGLANAKDGTDGSSLVNETEDHTKSSNSEDYGFKIAQLN